MKNKEFVKGVEGYGYSIVDFEVVYAIFNEFGYLIAYVSKVTRCEFELYYKKELGRELFSLIVVYSATPIPDREEESFLTTKEFIEKVKNLGFNVEIIKDGNPFNPMYGKDSILKIWCEEELVAKIWLASTYAINTFNDGHIIYRRGYDLNALYKLCFEYVKIPVEDR